MFWRSEDKYQTFETPWRIVGRENETDYIVDWDAGAFFKSLCCIILPLRVIYVFSLEPL